ncbi:MAG: hypothetical protein ABIZ70_02575 [Gemmatimonadales bacterium]
MRQQPGQQHTVGDTLTIVQRVRVSTDAVVQPRAPTDSSLVTMLMPPSLTREGETVRIDYHVALWQAGTNELTLPGAVVVRAGGQVDTLPDAHVLLQVSSLLPAGKAAATVPPRGFRNVLPRADRTALPFLVVPGVLLLLLALAWWWRRRRGPARQSVRPLMPTPIDSERIGRWLAAGEAQLALTHVEALLRNRPDLVEWRERAATARYAHGAGDELAALVREGWEQVT